MQTTKGTHGAVSLGTVPCEKRARKIIREIDGYGVFSSELDIMFRLVNKHLMPAYALTDV